MTWKGIWLACEILLGASGCGRVAHEVKGDDPGAGTCALCDEQGTFTVASSTTDRIRPASPPVTLVSGAQGHGSLLVVGSTPTGLWADLAEEEPSGLTLHGSAQKLSEEEVRPGGLVALAAQDGFVVFELQGSQLREYHLDVSGRPLSSPAVIDTEVYAFAAARGDELLAWARSGPVWSDPHELFLRTETGAEPNLLESGERFSDLTLATEGDFYALGYLRHTSGEVSSYHLRWQQPEQLVEIDLPLPNNALATTLGFTEDGLRVITADAEQLVSHHVSPTGALQELGRVPLPEDRGPLLALALSPEASGLLLFSGYPPFEKDGSCAHYFCGLSASGIPDTCSPILDPYGCGETYPYAPHHLLSWIDNLDPPLALGTRKVGAHREGAAYTARFPTLGPSEGLDAPLHIRFLDDPGNRLGSSEGVVGSTRALGLAFFDERPVALLTTPVLSLDDSAWLALPTDHTPLEELGPGPRVNPHGFFPSQQADRHWLGQDLNDWFELTVGSAGTRPLLSHSEENRPYLWLSYALGGYGVRWTSQSENRFAVVAPDANGGIGALPEVPALPSTYGLSIGPCAGRFYTIDLPEGAAARIVILDPTGTGPGAPFGEPFEAGWVSLQCDDHRLVLFSRELGQLTFLDHEGRPLGNVQETPQGSFVQEHVSEGLFLAISDQGLVVASPWHLELVPMPDLGFPGHARLRLRKSQLALLWNDTDGNLFATRGSLTFH